MYHISKVILHRTTKVILLFSFYFPSPSPYVQGVSLFCPVIPAFSRSCGKICISKVILHSTNKMILKWIATVVSVFSTIKVILLSINKVILFNISKLIRKRQDLYVFLLLSIIRVILYSTNKVILSNTTKVILFGRIYKGIVVSPGFLIFSVLLP